MASSQARLSPRDHEVMASSRLWTHEGNNRDVLQAEAERKLPVIPALTPQIIDGDADLEFSRIGLSLIWLSLPNPSHREIDLLRSK